MRGAVILGDGETQEGQVWEAAMSAAKFKTDHLIAIVDQNGYQQTGSTKEVLDLTPIAPRWPQEWRSRWMRVCNSCVEAP